MKLGVALWPLPLTETAARSIFVKRGTLESEDASLLERSVLISESVMSWDLSLLESVLIFRVLCTDFNGVRCVPIREVSSFQRVVYC